VGEVGNPVCGDLMRLYLRVGKNEKGENFIEDIKFETLGCVAAIATSSMITELANGKTLEEALKIEYTDVAKSLGGILKEELKLDREIIAIDGIEVGDLDYIDIGEPMGITEVIPVTVKSLMFPGTKLN